MFRLLPFFICLLLHTHCQNAGQQPTPATGNTGTDPSAVKTPPGHPGSAPPAAEPGGLTGTWKLILDAFDENNNAWLDPEERANATGNHSSYQFRPDGSCVIQGFLKGRYELKKENGKDLLIVYREKIEGEETEDPKPEKFRILSVNREELVLLMQESYNENTIWIFKRV